MSLSPIFTQYIEANVKFWLRQTSKLTDANYLNFETEHRNIYRAIEIGLMQLETWSLSVELAIRMFEFAEVSEQWWSWTQLLERAIQTCPEVNLELQCRLLNRVGFLYQLNGRSAKALEIHRAAKDIAVQVNNPYEEAYAHFFLGNDLCARHEYEEAEKLGLQALGKFSLLGITGREHIAVLNTLGMIAHAKGEFSVAEDRFKEAIDLWKKDPVSTKLAHTLNNLAITMQAQGKYEDALTYWREALSLLKPTSSKLFTISTEINMGGLYVAMGKLREAETLFRLVDIAFLQEAGQTYYLAAVANNLGYVLLELDQLAEAEEYLRISVSRWRTIKNELMSANAMGDLGKTLVRIGKLDEAKALFDEAISILVQYEQNAWAKKLHRHLLDRKKEIE